PTRFDWDLDRLGPPPKGFPRRSIAFAKIYELISGARLVGRTGRFKPVTAEVEVRTNLGRQFIWSSSTLADARGEFELTVPYSTTQRWRIGRTEGTGDYVIHCGEKEVNVDVPEKAINSGETIAVSCG
ncbi:MAG: hypothetical protein Q8R92_07735, partial [Deltaproteobacteria bacterium]|nr:hypothetical protein [Deltaproteobacteria bacterium]